MNKNDFKTFFLIFFIVFLIQISILDVSFAKTFVLFTFTNIYNINCKALLGTIRLSKALSVNMKIGTFSIKTQSGGTVSAAPPPKYSFYSKLIAVPDTVYRNIRE